MSVTSEYGKRLRPLLAALCVAGCATPPPPDDPAPLPPDLITAGPAAPGVPPAPAPDLALLPVSPSELGSGLQLNQHLTITRGGEVHDIDVALAIGDSSLKLAAVGLGLRLITVTWDGQTIREERHPLLPPQVSGERILRDLVLTWWPAQRLRAVLPAGWTLQDDGNERQLLWQGQLVLRIRYAATGEARWQGSARLEHVQHQYRIDIVSGAA